MEPDISFCLCCRRMLRSMAGVQVELESQDTVDESDDAIPQEKSALYRLLTVRKEVSGAHSALTSSDVGVHPCCASRSLRSLSKFSLLSLPHTHMSFPATWWLLSTHGQADSFVPVSLFLSSPLFRIPLCLSLALALCCDQYERMRIHSHTDACRQICVIALTHRTEQYLNAWIPVVAHTYLC
jgi:hypothetical protein